jgi:cellulose synthase (UDP-forming)
MLGVGLKTYAVHSLDGGDPAEVGLIADGVEYRFPVKVVVSRTNQIGLKLAAMTIDQERDYVRCTFAQPNAWADAYKSGDLDHPLASFAEVFSFGATGYVRLFESLYEGFIDWIRSGRRRREANS